MTLTDPYVDLATFKARANITGTQHDTVLTQVIAEASRQIERMTGRNFNQTPAGTARTYTAQGGSVLFVDDLVSVSAIATDDGSRTYPATWAATDYDLLPDEAPLFGRPYTRIDVAPTGRYGFPTVARGVRVTGVWGWPAVPDDIRGATFLLALRLWKRQDAPFGVTGSVELGQLRAITGVDPDVRTIVATYKRVAVF